MTSSEEERLCQVLRKFYSAFHTLGRDWEAVSRAADDVGPHRCEALYSANQAFLQLPYQPLLADAFVAMVKDHCHNLLDAHEGVGAPFAAGGGASNSEGPQPPHPASRTLTGRDHAPGGGGTTMTEEDGSGRSSQAADGGAAGSGSLHTTKQDHSQGVPALSREGEGGAASPRKGALLGAASTTGPTCSTSESPRATRSRRLQHQQPQAAGGEGGENGGGGSGSGAMDYSSGLGGQESGTPTRKGMRSPAPGSPRPPRQNKTQKKEMEQGVDALLQLARHASNMEPGHSNNSTHGASHHNVHTTNTTNTTNKNNHGNNGGHGGSGAGGRGGSRGVDGGSGSDGGGLQGAAGKGEDGAEGCNTPSRAGKRKTRPPSRLEYQLGEQPISPRSRASSPKRSRTLASNHPNSAFAPAGSQHAAGRSPMKSPRAQVSAASGRGKSSGHSKRQLKMEEEAPQQQQQQQSKQQQSQSEPETMVEDGGNTGLQAPMELLSTGGLTPGLPYEGANPFEVGPSTASWAQGQLVGSMGPFSMDVNQFMGGNTALDPGLGSIGLAGLGLGGGLGS